MLSRSSCLAVFCGIMLAGVPAFAQTAPKEATEATKQHNKQVLQELPFSNKQDFENAHKGFIATLPDVKIVGANGNSIWDLGTYAFLKRDVPPTANPSLWRIAQLNMTNGLFKVTDRIYQILLGEMNSSWVRSSFATAFRKFLLRRRQAPIPSVPCRWR